MLTVLDPTITAQTHGSLLATQVSKWIDRDSDEMVSFGNQGKEASRAKKISPSIYRELSSGGDVWRKAVEAQRVVNFGNVNVKHIC